MSINPFFINSLMCMEEQDVSSYPRFMSAVGGNTGNSYITYALIKELFGGLVPVRHIQNIYKYDFSNSAGDIDYINNQATHVFLVLQDQIRTKESYGLTLPYEGIKKIISQLNKPVIVAGLGANSFYGLDPNFHKKLSSQLVDFLKFLSEHCIEIGVRGAYTQEILHHIGVDNTRVIGCPSYFEMGRDRVVTKREIKDLNDVVLTQRLISCWTPKIHKIMQDFQEQEMIKPLAFGVIEKDFFLQRLEPIFRQTYHVFADIDGWKNFVKDYKFALGNRLHGSILALNSGVPALCLNKDLRTREMCDFLHIPHQPGVRIKTEKDILKLYDNTDVTELNKQYPHLYDNFIDFLHKNHLRLYTENTELHGRLNYVKQPQLTLYGDLFYKNLDVQLFKKQKRSLKYNWNRLKQKLWELKCQLKSRNCR